MTLSESDEDDYEGERGGKVMKTGRDWKKPANMLKLYPKRLRNALIFAGIV